MSRLLFYGLTPSTSTGDKPSIEAFSSSLLQYRICEGVDASRAENGITRIYLVDLLRGKEGLGLDIRSIKAKFTSVKIEELNIT
jgi:hypothetical protein